MTTPAEPDIGQLRAAWRMLKTPQPLEDMLLCPILKRVLLMVAKSLQEKRLTQRRELRLRQNLPRFDARRAQANDFDC